MSFFLLSCTAHEICPELEDRMASTGGFVHARLCIDQTPTSAIAAAISCWSVESWVMWLKNVINHPWLFFLISPIYSEIGNGLLFFYPHSDIYEGSGASWKDWRFPVRPYLDTLHLFPTAAMASLRRQHQRQRCLLAARGAAEGVQQLTLALVGRSSAEGVLNIVYTLVD